MLSIRSKICELREQNSHSDRWLRNSFISSSAKSPSLNKINFSASRQFLVIMAEKYEKAVSLLEKRIVTYSQTRVYTPTWNAKLHYLLGMAYEGLNKIELAREQYTIFLDIWGKPSNYIPATIDSRKRLQKLSAQ